MRAFLVGALSGREVFWFWIRRVVRVRVVRDTVNLILEAFFGLFVERGLGDGGI